MSLTIRSPAFEHEGEILMRHTCEGDDISPALEWSGVPTDARSLVLIVDDPDAPDPAAPRMTWVHWVVYNLPPFDGKLAENSARSLPMGADHGINDWKHTDYGGPCPPIGRHRYFHRLYALDNRLAFPTPPTRAEVDAAMADHILAEAVLMGTYRKQRPDER